jgi:hypothetical protein
VRCPAGSEGQRAQTIDRLARQGLARSARGGKAKRNGKPLLARGKGAVPVTLVFVNQLRDEQP